MSASITDLRHSDLQPWDAFVQSHPLGRCRVTSAAEPWWSRIAYQLHRLAAGTGDRVEAGLALAVKRISVTPWSVARIVALMPNAQDVGGSTAALLAEAERAARAERSLEIDFDCWAPLDFDLGGIRYAEPVVQALQHAGYAPVGEARGTYLVRIDRDDEALLGSFSSKARRDARKGLREGVVVRRLETLDELRLFSDTHEQMRQRKTEVYLDEFPLDVSQPLFERGQFRLFGAEYDGRIRNMALTDALGVPQYIRGAVSEAAFEPGVPPTGQPLHLGIMKHFREQGAPCYDLGGAPGAEPQPGHPHYTVWRFKQEFGGVYVQLLPRYRRSVGVWGRVALAAARRLLKKQ